MNKNTIGTYLILGSLVFILGFFLGRYSKKNEIFMGKDLKVLHQENKKEEAKIDSLETINHKIDLNINKFHKKKSLIRKEYEEDTIDINKLEFDSLAKLFTEYYPRTNFRNKQVSDTISLKR